jgi:imidazolonepropionase
MLDAGSYHLLPDAALVVSGGDILWAGPGKELPPQFGDECHVDLGGRLVTPGLIDCHTHLIFAGNRAREFERRLQGESYAGIAQQGGGIMATVRATREADVDDLVRLARPRLSALLGEGVTTVEIKSGYGLERDAEIRMLEAAGLLCDEAGVRCQRTFLAAHALATEFSGRSDEYIDAVCNDMLPAAVAAGVVDAVDAFCEGIGFSVSQVERVFARAREYGLPLKCHAEQLSNLGGAVMSARLGALSVDHIEYLPPEDVPVLAAAGTVAVLLPGAFYVLRETTLPPMDALRTNGVPMALATDANPGSSPVFSPLTIMNMGCTLFGMTPVETLAGFTINAARALGMEDRIGSIESGKAADLAIWDCEHPAELSYQIGLGPCAAVMQGGNWRKRLPGS